MARFARLALLAAVLATAVAAPGRRQLAACDPKSCVSQASTYWHSTRIAKPQLACDAAVVRPGEPGARQLLGRCCRYRRPPACRCPRAAPPPPLPYQNDCCRACAKVWRPYVKPNYLAYPKAEFMFSGRGGGASATSPPDVAHKDHFLVMPNKVHACWGRRHACHWCREQAVGCTCASRRACSAWLTGWPRACQRSAQRSTALLPPHMCAAMPWRGGLARAPEVSLRARMECGLEAHRCSGAGASQGNGHQLAVLPHAAPGGGGRRGAQGGRAGGGAAAALATQSSGRQPLRLSGMRC